MDLSGTVQALRADLADLAGLGDEQVVAVAARLAGMLEGSLSLKLIELASQIAAEVSSQLPSGRVEVRLSGSDPEFVYVDEIPPPPGGEEAELAARITLRLSEKLKARIDEAANREGISVNSWLIRTLSQAIAQDKRISHGRRMTGYGRS
jgi:hypothetical protein